MMLRSEIIICKKNLKKVTNFMLTDMQIIKYDFLCRYKKDAKQFFLVACLIFHAVNVDYGLDKLDELVTRLYCGDFLIMDIFDYKESKFEQELKSFSYLWFKFKTKLKINFVAKWLRTKNECN